MGIIIGEAPWFVKKRNLAELWICGKDVILWLLFIKGVWYTIWARARDLTAAEQT